MLKKYRQVLAIFTDTDTTSRYHKNRPIPPIPIPKYWYITSNNFLQQVILARDFPKWTRNLRLVCCSDVITKLPSKKNIKQ